MKLAQILQETTNKALEKNEDLIDDIVLQLSTSCINRAKEGYRDYHFELHDDSPTKKATYKYVVEKLRELGLAVSHSDNGGLICIKIFWSNKPSKPTS